MGLFGKCLTPYFLFCGLRSIGDKWLSASKAPSFGFPGCPAGVTGLPLITGAGRSQTSTQEIRSRCREGHKRTLGKEHNSITHQMKCRKGNKTAISLPNCRGKWAHIHNSLSKSAYFVISKNLSTVNCHSVGLFK